MAGRSKRPMSSADVLAEIFRDSASETEDSSESGLASSCSEYNSGMVRIS